MRSAPSGHWPRAWPGGKTKDSATVSMTQPGAVQKLPCAGARVPRPVAPRSALGTRKGRRSWCPRLRFAPLLGGRQPLLLCLAFSQQKTKIIINSILTNVFSKLIQYIFIKIEHVELLSKLRRCRGTPLFPAGPRSGRVLGFSREFSLDRHVFNANGSLLYTFAQLACVLAHEGRV